MPSSETVLDGLAAIANDWRWLAITWHVLFAALIASLLAGWRPSPRLLGQLLLTPLVSVSLMAWLAGNPFNGAVFAILAAVLLATAVGVARGRIRFASSTWVASGAAFVLFGWTYPHFIRTDSWTAYLYASPFGILPCPTLSTVIGMTIIFSNLCSAPWSMLLAGTGLVYGLIGVFRLGVALDSGLLLATGVLGAAVARDVRVWRSVRADRNERRRALPGDPFISEPLGTLTHAITIGRPARAVWPWLIQMGAGSRAGWYSYDVVDNGRTPSAARVVRELQDVAVGTVFPALPGVTEGFTVLAFEPNRSLILGWQTPGAEPLVTWAFVLEERAGHSTRLIVRVRGGQGYRFHGLPLWAVRLVHFVMERKQLLGIARRVEQTPRSTRSSKKAVNGRSVMSVATLNSVAVQGHVSRGFEDVHEAFAENFERRHELGGACTVYHRGEKVVDVWGGIRDKQSGEPWERDTMVVIHSATKGLAAMTLAIAHSRGWLDYDERVATYWPEFAQYGKHDITVRQLLAHQAGLFAFDEPVDRTVVADLDRLAAVMARHTPAWEPGTRQGYHGLTLGFYEGELMRRVDPRHRTLGQFFQDEIATPLGEDVYIRLPDEIPNSRLATLSPPGRIQMLIGFRPLRLMVEGMNRHSNIYRALGVNPGTDVYFDAHRVYARNLEVPAGGGVATARGIAHAYGVFATGGHELGLRKDTLEALAAPAIPPTRGFFDECLKGEVQFSLGFMKPCENWRFGGGRRSFGSPGTGGALGFADPDAGIGYAYVTSRMGTTFTGDPRDVAIRDALYAALGRS